VPLAQSNSSPIFELKGSDGLVGSQFKQQADYKLLIEEIVNKILHNLNIVN